RTSSPNACWSSLARTRAIRSASVSSTVSILRSGRRRRNALFALQFPHHQIAEADQERNKPDRPYAPFPLVHSAEEDHRAEPDHGPNHSAPHIRPLPHCFRVWCKQFCWYRLTLLHHHSDGALPRTAH